MHRRARQRRADSRLVLDVAQTRHTIIAGTGCSSTSSSQHLKTVQHLSDNQFMMAAQSVAHGDRKPETLPILSLLFMGTPAAHFEPSWGRPSRSRQRRSGGCPPSVKRGPALSSKVGISATSRAAFSKEAPERVRLGFGRRGDEQLQETAVACEEVVRVLEGDADRLWRKERCRASTSERRSADSRARRGGSSTAIALEAQVMQPDLARRVLSVGHLVEQPSAALDGHSTAVQPRPPRNFASRGRGC